MSPIIILLHATAFGLYGLFTGNREQSLFFPTSVALVCGWLPLLVYPPLGQLSWLRKMMRLSDINTNETTTRSAWDRIVDAALLAGCVLSLCYGFWDISGTEASDMSLTLMVGFTGAPLAGAFLVIGEILDRRMAESVFAMGRAIRNAQFESCDHNDIELDRVYKQPQSHDDATK